jgi:hypothetical protein
VRDLLGGGHAPAAFLFQPTDYRRATLPQLTPGRPLF